MDFAVTPGAQRSQRAWRTVSWLNPLLPNEPRILHPDAQAILTARYLLPVLPELESCLLTLRRKVDSKLERLQPVKLGKPYPLGQCLEITEAVQKRLLTEGESELTAEVAIGLRALRAFRRAGGDVRRVWGDLRGQYFQNALQVGTLYIDVANDTVTPTKPKVEILPFSQAQFIAIRDFTHFRQLARSYWGHEVYPNHVVPALAPHCPLIHVSKSGLIQLHEVSHYMLAMARAAGFASSEVVLREAPMPQAVFARVRSALQETRSVVLSTTPEEGRQQALQQCRAQRAKRLHQKLAWLAKITHDAGRTNQQLVRSHLDTVLMLQPTQEKIMPTIKIDNIDYDLDSLSDDARAQLQSIQFVDQELARLQAQLAAMQTARNTYINALKAALPVVSGSDSLPPS